MRFLCDGSYENCNNYEIYIYNNYEKLRSFRERNFGREIFSIFLGEREFFEIVIPHFIIPHFVIPHFLLFLKFLFSAGWKYFFKIFGSA